MEKKGAIKKLSRWRGRKEKGKGLVKTGGNRVQKKTEQTLRGLLHREEDADEDIL